MLKSVYNEWICVCTAHNFYASLLCSVTRTSLFISEDAHKVEEIAKICYMKFNFCEVWPRSQ